MVHVSEYNSREWNKGIRAKTQNPTEYTFTTTLPFSSDRQWEQLICFLQKLVLIYETYNS